MQQGHQSDPRVLGRRTLQQDHRRLAELLRPGLSVLDAGCGTGAITAGIAAAVGSSGQVLGIDRDASLLEIARAEYRGWPHLRFETADLLTLRVEAEFDIATAARLIQWISEPAEAIRALSGTVKPGGLVVALDYNHEFNAWTPEPPVEFRRFYRAFLDWRADNGWDNLMADHLPALFEAAGLKEITSHDCDEISKRGEAEFVSTSAIWLHVVQSLGPKIPMSETDLRSAEAAYREYGETRLNTQRLCLKTIVGRRAG